MTREEAKEILGPYFSTRPVPFIVVVNPPHVIASAGGTMCGACQQTLSQPLPCRCPSCGTPNVSKEMAFRFCHELPPHQSHLYAVWIERQRPDPWAIRGLEH